ncbi:MAG: hypothetical protein JWO36_7406 [Myxococcales bacterium]|nr:hypothetical protein [Myxococcales bacterium]
METVPFARRVAVAGLLAVLTGWSFWLRWEVLAASPFPIGVDGYFYPIQVRSLLEHGTLAYPASPFAFWLMAPFAAVTDPIIGAKIGAALGGAGVAIPAYLVGARLGKGRGPGLVAATIATMSASSAYLSIEFVKQGIGLTVALFALWLVLRAMEQRSRSRLIAAGIALVLALLAHKIAAAFVIVVAAPAAFAEARASGALRGRRLLYVLGGTGLAVVTVLVLGLAAPRRFISPADLSLLHHTLTRSAHWDAPALATPYLTLSFEHEVLFATVLAIIALVLMRRPRFTQTPSERIAMWMIIAFAIVLGVPWLSVTDQQGLVFRLRLCAFVPLALCTAIVVRAALARLAELHRDLACLAIAAVLAFRAGGFDRRAGEVFMHPALVASAMALDVPSNATVIVSERHIEFMVAWYTRADVSLRPELVPYNHRVRLLLPLSPVNTPWQLEQAVDAARHEPSIDPPIGVHPRHRNGLVLVTETTWDWMLTQMPPRTRVHFAAWPTI